MTTAFTYLFETCETCGDEWALIDTDEIQAKLSDQEIDRMIEQKATVRKGMEKYRRHIPAEIYDWAKHDYGAHPHKQACPCVSAPVCRANGTGRRRQADR